jgi:hypothetical protein
MLKLVTFIRWNMEPRLRTPVSINPVEVSDVEDCCGTDVPSSAITLRNKKVHLVMGGHFDIVAKLTSKEDSVG